METAGRLLELLSLLHTRPFWTCEELAERLEVTTRTVRRDVNRLRELGHPVEATRGRYGGYRLSAGEALPPLVLDDPEAVAVVVGLRLAATGAATGMEEASIATLAKLERVLPDRLRDRVQALQEATVWLPGRPAAETDPEQLVALAQACRVRHRIRFAYTARSQERTYRHAEPFRLVHAYGRWYLVAFDLDRDDWRTFRVDRASSVLVTDVPQQQRPEPDAAELVRAAFRGTSYEQRTALVRLYLSYDEAAAFVSSNWGTIERESDTTTLLSVGADDAAETARWLCLLPCRFEVVEPDAVRVSLHEHARRLLEA